MYGCYEWGCVLFADNFHDAFQISALSFLQIMLFALLAVFPLMWLPWPLMWVYGQLLWMTEPLLLVAEVVLLQNVVMRCGQYLAEKIDNDEDAAVSKVNFYICL